MKKIIYISAYLLFLLLFSTWMTNANRVIARLNGYEEIKEVSLEDYEERKKDEVVYTLRYVESNGDMLESSSIIGFSFIETEYPNDNKYTELLLANEKHCYRLPAEQLTDRDKYPNWMINVQELYPDRKVQDQYLGFIISFAGINIQDGIYNVYIYQWENEENYGFVRANTQIIKKEGDMQFAIDMLREIPAEQADEITDAKLMVGETVEGVSALVIDDDLLLSGAIFIYGQDCKNQKVYLRLQYDDIDTYYTSNSILRLDIAEARDDERVEMSGFISRIVRDDFPSDELTVTLYVENNGQMYQGRSYVLDFRGDEVVAGPGFYQDE